MKLKILLLTVLLLSGCTVSKPLSKTQLLLDTPVTITLYDNPSSNILEECFNICKNYELVFSRTNENSELYRLNHSDKTKPIEVSKELAKVIKVGLDYSALSNGSFDITIGSLIDLWDFKSNKHVIPNDDLINESLNNIGYQGVSVIDNSIIYSNANIIIDLGAVAKGYIADRIKDYLLDSNVNSAIINLGGNVLCVGDKSNSDFIIGISDPKSDNDIIELNINDLSVVTSGVYQRNFTVDDKLYHHLLNPATGYPYDNGLTSLTIISKESLIGDIFSTLCFSLGKDEALKLVNDKKGVECIIIDNDNNMYFSDNAKKYFHN